MFKAWQRDDEEMARLRERVKELEKKRFHTGAQVMKHFGADGAGDGE